MTNVIFTEPVDFTSAMRADTIDDPLTRATNTLYGGAVWQGEGKVKYLNCPFAFDIETTSTYTRDVPEEERTPDDKVAFMYIWQFGYMASTGYNIITGRTWEEFLNLMNQIRSSLNLDNEHRVIVYVHNLAFEFGFMQKLFQWNNVFFAEMRKPIYALTDGIEFRCSAKLSGGRSLDTIGKELTRPVYKMTGDLDYLKIRGPETPLTDKEFNYCIQDVAVLLEYIYEKIAQDGGISKIPLTNTGYVRRHLRDVCFPVKQVQRGNKAFALNPGCVCCCARSVCGRGYTCQPAFCCASLNRCCE